MSTSTLSTRSRWLTTLAVMTAAFMQVIDTTIVNVALPHMQGSLNTSVDEITWALTGYLVASAICMPLTGFFSDFFGRKKYLIFAIFGFTLSSALCGASTTLTQIVFFRMLQGLCGAALVPLSQAIMADIFPPHERGFAMTIWGMGVTLGPILGPTLGGYITDTSSWRWIFYINIPVGALALLLCRFVPDYAEQKRPLDWKGLALLSFGIGGLQYVLDQGNRADWFNSQKIVWMTILASFSLFAFIIHFLENKEKNLFNLIIFKDRNFSLGCLSIGIFCMGFYGVAVLQPLLMEHLLGYSVLITGLALAPRGLSTMLCMIFGNRLARVMDPRTIMLIGVACCMIGTYASSLFNLDVDLFWLIAASIFQGAGMGLIMAPLTTIAYSTLAPELRTDAAGIFNLLRTFGGSMGISISIAYFTRHSQFFWNVVISHIQATSPMLEQHLSSLHYFFLSTQQKMLILNQLALKQSQMLSFNLTFVFVTGLFGLMIPLILYMRPNITAMPPSESSALSAAE